jgi:hypothetical protein
MIGVRPVLFRFPRRSWISRLDGGKSLRRKSDAAWRHDHGSGDARIMNEGGRRRPRSRFRGPCGTPNRQDTPQMKASSEIATPPIPASAGAAAEAGATTRLRKRAGPRLCRIPFQDHIIPKAI